MVSARATDIAGQQLLWEIPGVTPPVAASLAASPGVTSSLLAVADQSGNLSPATMSASIERTAPGCAVDVRLDGSSQPATGWVIRSIANSSGAMGYDLRMADGNCRRIWDEDNRCTPRDDLPGSADVVKIVEIALALQKGAHSHDEIASLSGMGVDAVERWLPAATQIISFEQGDQSRAGLTIAARQHVATAPEAASSGIDLAASRGHMAYGRYNHQDAEFFATDDGSVFFAPVDRPLDVDGFRQGGRFLGRTETARAYVISIGGIWRDEPGGGPTASVSEPGGTLAPGERGAVAVTPAAEVAARESVDPHILRRYCFSKRGNAIGFTADMETVTVHFDRSDGDWVISRSTDGGATILDRKLFSDAKQAATHAAGIIDPESTRENAWWALPANLFRTTAPPAKSVPADGDPVIPPTTEGRPLAQDITGPVAPTEPAAGAALEQPIAANSAPIAMDVVARRLQDIESKLSTILGPPPMDSDAGSPLAMSDLMHMASAKPWDRDIGERMISRARDMLLGVEDYRIGYDWVVAQKDAILSDLRQRSRAELTSLMHGSSLGRNRAEMAWFAYGSIRRAFLPTPNGLIMYRHDGHPNAEERSERLVLEALTPEVLATRRGWCLAEREELRRALTSPTTCQDFRLFVKHADVHSLTDAELATWHGMEVRELRRTTAARSLRVVNHVDDAEGPPTTMSVSAPVLVFSDGRAGGSRWAVPVSDILDGMTFRSMLESAIHHQGWYAIHRGDGAIPGFQFATEEQATAFAAEANRHRSLSAHHDVGLDAVVASHREHQSRDLAAALREASGREGDVQMAQRLHRLAEGAAAGLAEHLHPVRSSMDLAALEAVLQAAHTRRVEADLPGQGPDSVPVGAEDLRHLRHDGIPVTSESCRRVAEAIANRRGCVQFARTLAKAASGGEDVVITPGSSLAEDIRAHLPSPESVTTDPAIHDCVRHLHHAADRALVYSRLEAVNEHGLYCAVRDYLRYR